MGDWLTRDQRRRNMSAIRSKNTKAERQLEQLLKAAFPNRRIRAHEPLLGRPDFYLPALRLAVFADGCYWHSCPEHGRIPDDNNQYWTAKLHRNRSRDQLVVETLERTGVMVYRVWEHELAEASLRERLETVGQIALQRRRRGSSAASVPKRAVLNRSTDGAAAP